MNENRKAIALIAGSVLGLVLLTLLVGKIPAQVTDVVAGAASGFFNGKLGINSSTPSAQITVVGTGTTNPVVIASSSGSILLQISGTGSQTTTVSVPFVVSSLYTGNWFLPTDSGEQNLVDMSVTASSANNTPHSYVMKIDNTPLFRVYAESDGAGGIKNLRIKEGRANVSTVKFVGTGDGCSAYTYSVSTTNPTPTATSTSNCNQ